MDLSLGNDVEVQEESDSLGGGYVDSGIYQGNVKMCFLDASKSGAVSVNIHFEHGGRTTRQTIYISTAKRADLGNNVKFTYTDKKSGKELPLPGYSQMDSFFKVATGQGIAQQTKADKVVALYDFAVKAEVDRSVSVFTDVLGKELAIAIQHVSEEKTTKESGYKDGTGEYIDKNEFAKFFLKNGLTLTEQKAGETKPAFLAKWKADKAGKTVIRKAKNSGAAEGQSTSAPIDKPQELFS